MKEAEEYLAYIKALIIADPKVRELKTLREEAQGDLGLFRYRITFQDGSLLEMFERFQSVNGELQVVKYRSKGQQRISAIAADLPVKELLEAP